MGSKIKSDLLELEKIFNLWDPIGRLSEDEYNSYAMPVLSLLYNNKSKDDLEKYLSKMLCEMGLKPGEDELEKVSNLIFKWWNLKKEQRQTLKE